MLSGFRKGTLQFLQFFLLADAFRLGCIKHIQFFLGVTMFQFLGLILLFTNGTDGGKGILVTEAS